MSATQAKAIISLLKKAYGTPVWKPNHDPLSEMVKTILSQNTSDVNSRPAFHRLMSAFKSWGEIAGADIDDIAAVIKSSGLGHIKANRIRQALREIKLRNGALNLDFLDKLSLEEAGDWLKKLPGVGEKTAGCVLLFALGKPALPVDTHIFRVSKRLGLIPASSDLKEAHQKLGGLVSGRDVYAFHVLMIEHGRKMCIARRPLCPECVLRRICPSHEIFMGHPAVS